MAKKRKSEKHGRAVGVKFTQTEYELVLKRALEAHVAVSTWVRMKALVAASVVGE